MDIQHASTLEDGLADYFHEERLEGVNAYKCEKCKTKVPANRKFSLERAPNVLCIQLKRFGLVGGKMSKHIQFSRTLDLSRFLFNQPADGTTNSDTIGGSTYKFVSLISHLGPSENCGHYSSIAEASNGSLYHFNDSEVRISNFDEALSTGAYALFYERNPPTAEASPAPIGSGASLANSSTKANGSHSANSPVATAAPPPPKPMIPRPALISEPSEKTAGYSCEICAFKTSRPRLMEMHKKAHLNRSATVAQAASSKSPTKSVAQKRPRSKSPAQMGPKPLPPKRARKTDPVKEKPGPTDVFDQVKGNLETKDVQDANPLSDKPFQTSPSNKRSARTKKTVRASSYECPYCDKVLF